MGNFIVFTNDEDFSQKQDIECPDARRIVERLLSSTEENMVVINPDELAPILERIGYVRTTPPTGHGFEKLYLGCMFGRMQRDNKLTFVLFPIGRRPDCDPTNFRSYDLFADNSDPTMMQETWIDPISNLEEREEAIHRFFDCPRKS